MGALLKGRERVALKFEGNGPLRKIVVEANAQCRVHGYVGNPDVDLPPAGGRFDVASALGRAGLLTVTKDLLLKEPYQGVVNLVSSEIGDDLAYYLTESEQIPSAVGLTAVSDEQGRILAAGGFLLQALPGADLNTLDAVTARIEALPPLGKLFLDGAAPKEILDHILGETAWQMLGRQEVCFQCDCSRDRVEQALITLGHKEIEELAGREENTVITCEFCREAYAFTPEQLHKLAVERH
jgi:molecular chaperone Hsp33